MNGDFAHLRLEHKTLNADDISDIPLFKCVIHLFAEVVILCKDLDLAASVVKIHEHDLALAALAHDPARYGDRLLLVLVEGVDNILSAVCSVVCSYLKGVTSCILKSRKLISADCEQLLSDGLCALFCLFTHIFHLFFKFHTIILHDTIDA